jgi:hypothetical protein
MFLMSHSIKLQSLKLAFDESMPVILHSRKVQFTRKFDARDASTIVERINLAFSSFAKAKDAPLKSKFVKIFSD